MLTATKDLMLPATVTGSWPRPRWYVPAADPAVQVDDLPDREPLTRLPSPWQQA